MKVSPTRVVAGGLGVGVATFLVLSALSGQSVTPTGSPSPGSIPGAFSLTSEQSSTATGSASLALSSQVSVVRWTGAGDVTWTDWTGFRPGAMVLFINGTSAYSATFLNDNATSTKDFYTPLGVPLVCGPKSSTWVYYSSSANRWRPVGGAGCNPMPSSSPDGVVTAPKGTTVTDRTTGVTWRNRSGGTRWNVASVPPEWGYYYFNDFESVQGVTGVTVGTGSVGFATPTLAHPSEMQLVITAANDVATIRGSNVSAIVFGAGEARFRTSLRITTLSDATDRHTVRVGWGDSVTAADHTDGVYLEYSLAGNGSNNWFLCAANNGTRTKVDTGIAPAASTYTTVEIVVNAAGTSAVASIDGVAAANPVTTNIPTASGRESGLLLQNVKDLGSGSRAIKVDWVEQSMILSAARSL